MKHLYAAIIFVFVVASLCSIQVSGEQSGTWTSANNPYQVVGNITVPTGANLTIEPGVRVLITGNFQITIAGTMTAVGAVADSIRFINAQTPVTTLWPGLRFENTTQPSNLSRVYIEYATYGIRCMNSPLTVSASHITLCQKGMELYAIGSNNPSVVTVQNNLIERCIQNGILISQNSNATVNNNELRRNGTGTQFMAAIQLSNQSPGGSNNPIVSNNHIHHNLKQGISAWDVVGASAINPQITNNIIEYNYTGLYLLNASGYVADNQINNNFIPGDMNSGAGVMVSGVTSVPYFERNTITGNYTGLYITNNAVPVLGDMASNHIWAQGENVIRNNIDANGDLHTVFCAQYANASNTIKAENNDWGFYTPDEIAQSIQDHADLSTLPTIDYEPFITNVLPTSINGTYFYDGISNLSEVTLQLVSVAEGHIIQSFSLVDTNINVTAIVEEPFYAMIVATRTSDLGLVYGCSGGFTTPTVLYPGDFAPVDTGNILVNDETPPHYKLMGDPVVENELTLHPQMSGFALYGWDTIDWLYQEGDFLYLKKHQRRVNANVVTFDLPVGTVWTKVQNIGDGDTWQHSEVVDNAGTINVSTVHIDRCSTYMDTLPYLLHTRKDAQGNVIDKMIPMENEDMLFRYQNGYLLARESVAHLGNTNPLEPGALRLYVSMPTEDDPGYLGYNANLLSVPPGPYSVNLYWIAPAISGSNWTHYRIYRNLEAIADIPFSQSEYTDNTFLANETTYYEVRATDGQVFSDPTNWVLVTMVGVEDELIAPVQLSISPNPAHLSSGEGVTLKFANLQHRKVDLAVYNIKGQLVHQSMMKDIDNYQWQGCDLAGKRCASGIYFLKAKVSGMPPITRKIVVY